MTPAPVPQQDIESLRNSVRSLTGELLLVYEELSLLYNLGARIGRLADGDQIAAVALREAVEVLSADCGWVVRWDDGQPRVPDGCLLAIQPARAEHINFQLLQPLHRQGKQQVLVHSLADECQIQGPGFPGRLLASSLDIAGTPRGYLCLGRQGGGRIFTSADQKLITAVASLTSMELENVRLQRSELEKQRLVKEMEMARRIQQWLLPRDFSGSDFLKAAGLSEPCYEIGGDYYDLLPISADQCLMVIADVTGKGAPASLQAALIQGIVQGTARHSLDLSCLMQTLNDCILARAVEGKYPTALLATLDRGGRLTYANGGHTPPIWIHAGGGIEELGEGGPLLGFLPEAIYPQGSAQLAPGDLLLFYTDGVTDAEDGKGDTFGLPRLLDWAQRQAGRPPDKVKDSLLSTITEFCRGTQRSDDLTALVVECLANEAA